MKTRMAFCANTSHGTATYEPMTPRHFEPLPTNSTTDPANLWAGTPLPSGWLLYWRLHSPDRCDDYWNPSR